MKDQPNIILIVLDTVRAEQLGLYGREIDPMPNLTNFAEDATVYDRAYTNAPWTLPAHASLFTGQLPIDHGCHGESPQFDPDTEPLAVRLSEAGYETYGISNNIWISDHFGFAEGFDTFYKQWQLLRESRDLGHVLKKDYESRAELLKELVRGNPAVNLLNGLYGKYLYRRNDFGAKRTTNDILKILTQTESPFFLFANYMEAHAPYQEHECSSKFLPDDAADPSHLTDLSIRSHEYHTGEIELSKKDFREIEALYDGELRYLDKQLDRLFEYLGSEDLFQESFVVVVGDHGENIGDHGLMEHRFSMHDTLLHVPLVVKTPEGFQSEDMKRNDTPVSLVNLFEFLLGAGSGDSPTQIESNLPIVSQYLSTSYTPEARDEDFQFENSRFDRRLNAIISGDYKMIVDDSDKMEVYQFDGVEHKEVDETSVPEDLVEHCVFLEEETSQLNSPVDQVKDQLEELGYL